MEIIYIGKDTGIRLVSEVKIGWNADSSVIRFAEIHFSKEEIEQLKKAIKEYEKMNKS